MNLIEKWKNRETKKKLREEIARLTEENARLKNYKIPIIRTFERMPVQTFVAKHTVYEPVTADEVKEHLTKYITRDLCQFVAPCIEWTTEKDWRNLCDVVVGTLYIAIKEGGSDGFKENN